MNAAAAGQVTVTFNNVLPPSSASAAAHWTSIKTTTANDETIDDHTGETSGTCQTPAAVNTVGKSTINTQSTTVPSNAGYTGADLYLRFSLGKTTPAGSLLKITSPTTSWAISTDLNNKVYFSKIYSAVSVSGATLQLTLSESISAGAEVELYVEGALTFADTATATGNFLIETTYFSVVLNQDTANATGTNPSLALTTKAAGTISGGTTPVATDTSTKLARKSLWTFSFSSNQPFIAGDQFWIQFPKDFDPDLGYAHIKYTQEPAVYYIPCSSEALGTAVECVVDHYYLKVMNASAIDASASVTLEVENVTTPHTAAATGDFKLFHINGWNAKAVGTLSGITTTALPANITVKKSMTSSVRLFGSGDYTFEFYVGTNLTSDHSLYLLLPRQFDSGLSRNEQDISCALAYTNHADDSASLEEQSVSGVSSCKVDDNWVEMSIPTGGVTTGSTIRLKYSVTSLKNPEWGYTRSSTSNTK